MGKRANGEGSIYYDKAAGKWYGAITIGGKQQKTRGCRTQKEARQALDELKRKLNGVSLGEYRNLEEYLTHWVETVVKPNCKLRTYKAYKHAIDTYIVPHLGKHKLTDMTPMHVAAAQNVLLRSLAQSTVIAHFRSVLKSALNQAFKWGLVNRNVVLLVDPPRVPVKKARFLKPDECRRLLAALDGHRLYAMYRLALALGLRKGELLALRWSDLDWAACTLRVSGTMGANGRQDETKTGLIRVLELPPSLVGVLRQRYELWQIEAMHEDWQEHGLIFPTEIGTPQKSGNHHRQFKALLKAAGLPDMRFHDLRHTHAALHLSSGGELETLKRQLGHSSIQMTSDVYGHLLPGVLRQATTRVDDLLAG